MRLRSLLAFIVVNVVVTGLSVFIFTQVFDSGTQPASAPSVQVVELIITATPDPNATPIVRIITATPRPGEVGEIPADILEEVGTQEIGAPNTTPGAPRNAAASTTEEVQTVNGTPVPAGCIPHTLASGESPALLAEIYGTDVFSILLVNNLTEEDASFLQIGQVLIVPLEGCELLEQVASVTEDPDATDDTDDDPNATEEPVETEEAATPTPTITPTITLAPTATNAQVEIIEIVAAGDITREAVAIRNNGQTVNLLGWTLSDADGNTYEFTDRNLFNDAEILIYTRVGQSTPAVVYWGRSTPVWGEPGDVVTLLDDDGNVQAVLRLPSPIDLD